MRSCQVVIEKAKNNYSAYIPNLPGCVTTGNTIEEIKQNISEAITFHLEGLEIEGLIIPDLNFTCFEFITI